MITVCQFISPQTLFSTNTERELVLLEQEKVMQTISPGNCRKPDICYFSDALQPLSLSTKYKTKMSLLSKNHFPRHHRPVCFAFIFVLHMDLKVIKVPWFLFYSFFIILFLFVHNSQEFVKCAFCISTNSHCSQTPFTKH